MGYRFLKKIFYSNAYLIFSNALLVLLIVAGLIFFKKNDTILDKPLRDETGDYIFTSPILDYEDSMSGRESIINENSLKSLVEKLIQKNNLSHISVYFRDLNDGPWVGVGEKETFSPASLLKVPVLMSLLKESEDKPEILNKKIIVKTSDYGNQDIQQNFNFKEGLVSGKEYTLLDIAKVMIKNSDNVAASIVIKNIEESYIAKTFNTVGVPFSGTEVEPSVTVKDYSGFFRVLYNSTYLTRDKSELALSILSQSDFMKGLVAGVPENIQISHKFGERGIQHLVGEKIVTDELQLHDCGIVYYPKRPYLICVMTRGKDYNVQENIISTLSRYVYDSVEKNYK